MKARIKNKLLKGIIFMDSQASHSNKKPTKRIFEVKQKSGVLLYNLETGWYKPIFRTANSRAVRLIQTINLK